MSWPLPIQPSASTIVISNISPANYTTEQPDLRDLRSSIRHHSECSSSVQGSAVTSTLRISSRNTRLVLGKAGKTLAKANTRAAQLEAENQRLKYQMDSTKITRFRKRVQVNPNECFSNVEAVNVAIDQAAALQTQQHCRLSRHHIQMSKKSRKQQKNQQL